MALAGSRKRSQKELESMLQELEPFVRPQAHLEQYVTPAEVAAHVLHSIGMHNYDDIAGKNVLDLGCGSGILGMGCILMEAAYVVGVDIDVDAIQVALENVEDVGLSSENISFVNCDVSKLTHKHLPQGITINTVITNPPFGVQGKEGIDYTFVEKGLELGNIVYCLHKSATRDFWKKAAPNLGAVIEFVIQDLDFGIQKTFKFHKETVYEVKVDLIRFSKNNGM